MKSIKRQKLVGRMFVTVALRPAAPDDLDQGCCHDVEVENTTTILYDAVVHSRLIEGVRRGANHDMPDIEVQCSNILDTPVSISTLIEWPTSAVQTIKVHTHKLSHKCDLDRDWLDDLIDPIIEVAGRR